MKGLFTQKNLAGHGRLGRHLLEFALDSDFDPSYSHRVKIDHGIGIPIWRMNLDKIPSIIPVFINLVEKPFPTPKRCIAWGHMIREAIETFPDDIRVAVLGTGGLSHSIGEPTMGWIDEAFDRNCIELFKTASDEILCQELGHFLKETGNGGAELRSWSNAHAGDGGAGVRIGSHSAGAGLGCSRSCSADIPSVPEGIRAGAVGAGGSLLVELGAGIADGGNGINCCCCC